MRHDDPSQNIGFSTGDRVELVFTSDPYTRLRPGDRGTVTGVGQVPSDPPEPQVHVGWDSGSTLSMLLGAGDQLRKLADDHDAADSREDDGHRRLNSSPVPRPLPRIEGTVHAHPWF